MIVPATEAIAIGAKAWIAKCLKITSRAKRVPAIGALNEALTAAATAHPNRSRAEISSTFMKFEIQVEVTAAK